MWMNPSTILYCLNALNLFLQTQNIEFGVNSGILQFNDGAHGISNS